MGAGDAVHAFTLSQGTRVRLSTEGSSYDTVLALVGDGCMAPDTCNVIGETAVAVPSSSEDVPSAIVLGELDDRIVRLNGDTTGMNGDFTQAHRK